MFSTEWLSGDRRSCLAILALVLMPAVASGGLFSDDTAIEQQRQEIQQMRDATLARLYTEKTEAKAEIEAAAGYAVFDSTGVHVLLVSGGFGKGIAYDNASGQNTYMKMFTGGAGPGLGIKDYRVVFVFHTREKFEAFIAEGWSFEGLADAAARTPTKGGDAGGAISIPDAVSIYQLTEAGLALQLSLQGTRFTTFDELNQTPTPAPQ